MTQAFELRAAKRSDLEFCWPIYRDALRPLTEAFTAWQEPAQRRVVEKALGDPGASILRAGGVDAGWLQVAETGAVIELRQFFVVEPMRNQGLGTSFLAWMKERAERKRKDLVLEVTTNNPARRLCDRLGFKPVKTADNKVTMRF